MGYSTTNYNLQAAKLYVKARSMHPTEWTNEFKLYGLRKVQRAEITDHVIPQMFFYYGNDIQDGFVRFEGDHVGIKNTEKGDL